MPRPSRSDKFFYQVPRRTGARKGQVFFGTNTLRKRDGQEITLQDLFDFMKEKGIDPAKVSLPTEMLFWEKP